MMAGVALAPRPSRTGRPKVTAQLRTVTLSSLDVSHGRRLPWRADAPIQRITRGLPTTEAACAG